MESVPRLSTPEEELQYLREQVMHKEAELAGRGKAPNMSERVQIISEKIHEHRTAPEKVLSPEFRITESSVNSTAEKVLASLNLGDGEEAIKGLLHTMEEKGIKNAFSVLDTLQNPRLADDFHRYLVRYIATGLIAPGFNEKAPRFRALKMTLYEIALPGPKNAEQDRSKTLKELISRMEQFYAGLLSVEKGASDEPNYFVLELAVPSDSPELQFYAAVPNGKHDLFEKQLLAIFPDAHMVPQPRDYNIFAAGGVSLVSTAAFAENPALPLKDYADFDYDPINTITNAFAKIEHIGEGAALQIIVEPQGEHYVKHYRKVLQALRKGEKSSVAFNIPSTVLGSIALEIKQTLFSTKPKDAEKAKQAEIRQAETNKSYIEQVEKKTSASIAGVTMRLVVSSSNESKAAQVLDDLESAFNQFANTQGNRLKFMRTAPRRLQKTLDDFSFRLPDSSNALPMSLRELTALYHFPPSGIQSSPHLKQARFTHAPAPLSLPKSGVLLGINTYRSMETSVHLSPEDRLRHLYIIGQTGTGKTGLMKSMIIQDIRNGEGCCFIDPHGSDILDILAAVPPERYKDVIYFDPADLSRPFGLNFLEYDLSRPEQKTFIVNELLMIFRRLYGDVPESMGPAFEQYFRNATLLVMEDPTSGSTMLDIARVLSNKEFRTEKLAKSMNPVVNQFWNEIATKAGGDAALENIVPYITNKFDDFTANDFIRPIVGQQESSFRFREVMDMKKILLINLSKGRLGERNANLLGLIIVGKLFMAALSRADAPEKQYPPFYLYIDEFQNITTDSIPGILSEARKYKLSLTMAHQFLKQIEDRTRDAVFGNVGNMAVFRVGEEDAEVFAKQFAPVFEALDFVNIENRNAYVKILSEGVPQKPFDMKTSDIVAGDPGQVKDLIHLSSLTYGRDRATVENMIRERYLTK
ncbi:MAG: TraM recognition domain-containing protein [bacterium]|nr:TraM recognition domain-containing protein [bacterium]MDO8742709.1 TraM recognition domain-containing protein [bacterium]